MSSEDLRQEIRRHRDLVDLCTARNADGALVCLKEGLDDSRAFAIRFTFEALELAKSKSPDAWLGRA
jgi:DNA-binding GntR family transcriptional regulator